MTGNQLHPCPASSLDLDPDSTPAWLSQLAELVFDHCDDQFRGAWAEQLRSALRGLNGPVPFRLFHHWHATSVSRLLIESATQRRISVREHEDVRQLHRDASDGRNVGEEAWRAALEPALQALYRAGYPYDEAFSQAANGAASYARLHGYAEDEATKYGRTYAEINTEANVRLFSAANARANSKAYAAAFADSDHDLLGRSYPTAYIQACVALTGTERSVGYARLGTGLIDSIKRY